LNKVKIILDSEVDFPRYGTEGSSGLDLKANIDHRVSLKPLQRVLIPSGIRIELPKGFEAQIRPRSGNALKKGLGVLNSPATIDSDFRGEIGIILVNLSNEIISIEPKDKVAQIVFSKYEKIEWENVSYFTETERGSKGFGSTGN